MDGGCLHSGPGSAGRDTAIGEKRLAGYVTAGFGGQKDDGSVKIAVAPWLLRGNPIRQAFHPRGTPVHDLVHAFGLSPRSIHCMEAAIHLWFQDSLDKLA